MTYNELKECLIPNRLLLLSYTAGVAGMVVISILKGVEVILTPEVIALSLVFTLLASLVLLKGISILKCPSKVILGGAVFVAITAFVDSAII